MSTDWLDEGLTEQQRTRFRSCWVMLTEQSDKKQRVFTLRPYLYEQFFAPDAQRKAVPMILDILTMMTRDLPVLIHFHCTAPDHPDAAILADCAESFGFVVRDPDSPSFLLHPSEHLPLDLLSAMLFDPDSAFHVICHIPQRFLMSKLSAMPYHGCLWYLAHGLGRMRLDYLSGRPMLEIQTDGDVTPEFLMNRITPMVWRHGYRLVLHKT